MTGVNNSYRVNGGYTVPNTVLSHLCLFYIWFPWDSHHFPLLKIELRHRNTKQLSLHHRGGKMLKIWAWTCDTWYLLPRRKNAWAKKDKGSLRGFQLEPSRVQKKKKKSLSVEWVRMAQFVRRGWGPVPLSGVAFSWEGSGGKGAQVCGFGGWALVLWMMKDSELCWPPLA